MRAAAAAAPQVAPAELHSVLTAGRADDSPIVRLEALRSLRARNDAEACAAALAATGDRDMHVDAVRARSARRAAASAPDAVAALERTVTDLSDAGAPRGWHRAAHALVALAAAAPERGDRRAAAVHRLARSGSCGCTRRARRRSSKDREALDELARDDGRQRARGGGRRAAQAGRPRRRRRLRRPQLSRNGYQILRAAALALDGTPHPDAAVPALKAAWQRLVAEGRDNSHDARDAIAKTLTALGDAAEAARGRERRRRPISTPTICAASRRRARASRSAASASSSSRCSPSQAPADGPPLRAPRGVGLLQRPHVPPRRRRTS